MIGRECCEHCTLPLGARVVVAQIDQRDGRFCCYGCVLAHQITRASGEDGEASTIVIRLGLAIFFAMNVMAMSLPGYSSHVYGNELGATDGPLFLLLRYMAMAFSLPVLLLLGWPIASSFVVGGWRGGAVADALVLLGATAAFFVSVARTWDGAGPVYFDTAVMVLVLVTLGRFLEARVRADAGKRVRADLQGAPTHAIRIEDGQLRRVPVDELRVGDVLRIVGGESFPTDAVVQRGRGSLDQSLLSGEAKPLPCYPGREVAGGATSIDGTFDVKVLRLAAESAAARIAGLLDKARREASPIEAKAEKFARVFLPLTVFVASVSGVYHGYVAGVDRGVLTSLSVLVVACPCALGIATPVALWFGVVAAARRGIVIRDAGALERASRVGTVYFDKTGTLTTRTPRLVLCEVAPSVPRLTRSQLLAYAAALEMGQRHPLARAVAAAAPAEPEVGIGEATEVTVVAGKGIRGVVEGRALAMGNAGYAEEWRRCNTGF